MDLANPGSAARSLTSQVFERLRADILDGVLRPQEKLKIQGLVARYEVGATAIREALSRLVSDGLVDSEDQRGFTVAPVSEDELLDLTRTRIQIEQLALRQAIAEGDLEWESALLAAWHRLARTPLPTTPELAPPWALAHRQFHAALLAGCGSPWLMRLAALLHDKSDRYRNLAARHTTRENRDIAAEHRALLDAAMGRDADAACRLIEAHFQATARIIQTAGFG